MKKLIALLIPIFTIPFQALAAPFLVTTPVPIGQQTTPIGYYIYGSSGNPIVEPAVTIIPGTVQLCVDLAQTGIPSFALNLSTGIGTPTNTYTGTVVAVSEGILTGPPPRPGTIQTYASPMSAPVTFTYTS